MAQVTGRLIEGKPIVEVTLADALPRPQEVGFQGSPTFNVRPYRALLDTGADITCLCDHVVSECKLKQVGFEKMVGALGASLHETYIVRIGILTGDTSDDSSERGLFQLEPLEAPCIRDNQWFDILIGTDVLAHHEFSLTRGGMFRLSLF